MQDDRQYIVFFDGVCGLCNGVVDFLLKSDRKHLLKFSPLQGRTFQAISANLVHPVSDSIVYYRNGKFYYESSAALYIAIDLGGLYAVSAVLFLFPAFIRNVVYRFIAKRRYRWFGRKSVCRIPVGKERAYFLD